MMGDYKELDTRLTQLKIWREDVQNTLDRIDEEIAGVKSALREMRLTKFKEQYGFGKGDLVKVPPEWETEEQTGMKADTIWELRDVTFDDSVNDGVIITLTYDGYCIDLLLKSVLTLRQYWLDSERPHMTGE